MQILVVSHGSDNDGYASAAYADHLLSVIGHEITIVGVDYGDRMPTAEQLNTYAEQADLIFVCDFVLDHQIMEDWHAQGKLIWIDHHKSSIEDSLEFEYHKAPGIRRIGTAACMLTYEYLTREFTNFDSLTQVTRNGSTDLGPWIIRYLAKYDVWTQDHEWDTITLPVQYACMGMADRLRIGSEKFRSAWEELFRLDDTSPEVQSMIDVGTLIAGYQREMDNELTPAIHGAKIEGYPDFLFFALNGGRGTGPFDSLDKDGFDGMMVYKFTGTEWKISLYGWDGSPDMSEIAKSFGGGGHRAACGFRLGNLHPTIQIYPLNQDRTDPGETPPDDAPSATDAPVEPSLIEENPMSAQVLASDA